MSDVPAQFLYDSTNLIVVGSLYSPISVYTDSDIRSGNVFISNSLACDELTIDTMDAQVDGSKLLATVFKPKNADRFITADLKTFYVAPLVKILANDPTKYTYGQEVFYFHNQKLIGKFYVAETKRISKYIYSVSCVSAIGLLDKETHYGDVYSGTSMEIIVADIIGQTVTYKIDESFVGIPVYGWLPIASKRSNLHQLLFAMGGSITKDETGTMVIAPMQDLEATEIFDENIYIGGSVEFKNKISRVIISEHDYNVALSVDNVIYEGEILAETIVTPKGKVVSGALLTFNAPTKVSYAEGDFEILEHTANYVVLSSGRHGKLYGKEYAHTTRQIIKDLIPGNQTRTNLTIRDSDAVVDNATLVSALNSENVANRVMAYYSSAENVSADIVVTNEKPGQKVSLNNVFGEESVGYIKSLDISMSKTLKANAEIIENYTPTGSGNYYKTAEIITESTYWVVPEGVYKVRIILIGGGQGGQSGSPGKNGEGKLDILSAKFAGKGGEGGNGGEGGHGGKVYSATVNVTPGESIKINIGEGGIGGIFSATSPVDGSEGGDTTFGSYSSADGTIPESGYTDSFLRKTVSTKGNSGVKGAVGGGSNGMAGSINGFSGGLYGPSFSNEHGAVNGGYGGGAAYGANGESGRRGNIVLQPNGTYFATGGAGGEGGAGDEGEPPNNSEITIGNGGNGGNGGGGGGAGGAAASVSGDSYAVLGNGGLGGLGGQGGKGHNGGVFIYH